MISFVVKCSLAIFLLQGALMAQEVPLAAPDTPSTSPTQTPTQDPSPQIPPPPPPAATEELSDSGMVMKKNNFSYDSNEGRDPFKIYREIIFPTDPGGKTTPGPNTPTPKMIQTDGILTAQVPSDITIVGILFKKNDPIVLVKVKSVKGVFKLKMNSRIGRNEGRVIDIQKDKMTVEQVRDFDGQKYTEKVELKIREKKR